jgi:MSHA pilin protein MshA
MMRAQAWRAAGLALASHWCAIAWHKWSLGVEGQLLWMSHAALALGAAGLLLGSAPIIGSSFVAIAGLHALWMFDALAWLLTGTFPLGITSFIADMDAAAAFGTSHHVYLAPLMGAWLWSHRAAPKESLPAAIIFFAALALASRFALPPDMNINWCRAAWKGSDSMFWQWVNHQSPALYLLMLVATVFGVFMAPAALLMRAMARSEARPAVAHATITTRPALRPRRARAFTLIELVAVMIVLAILAAVAVPRYFDHTTRARQTADEGALAGIRTALHNTYLNNRSTGASSSSWVTSVNQIAAQMDTRTLPLGITISGSQLRDSRGNLCNLTAETQTTPALITAATSGSGGSGGSGSGGGGDSGLSS